MKALMSAIPDIKDLVRDGKKVFFVCYKSKELHYRHEDGFEFSVPVDDTGEGEFGLEDSAMFFMRWIRKEIKRLQEKHELTAMYRSMEEQGKQ